MRTPTLLTLLAAMLAAAAPAADQFEPDHRTVSTAELVPPALIEGPHHRIEPEAAVEGFVATFRVVTERGTFEAHGAPTVAVRVHEVDAIHVLGELSKSKVFVDAMARTAKRPVTTVKQTVEDPVGTAKKIPGGVVRLFRRTVRQVEDGYGKVQETLEERQARKAASGEGNGGDSSVTSEDVKAVAGKGYEEGKEYALDQVGYSSAYRQLAKQLDVDPYTDNEVLKDGLGHVAWVSAAGSFGMGELMPSMPKEFGYVSDVNDLVWNMHPVDLRIRNEDTLRDMGISESDFMALFDNRHYSLTDSTSVVESLVAMDGVEDRSVLVQLAAAAETKVEARFFVASAGMLTAFHTGRAPLSKLAAARNLPMGLTGDGIAVLPVPVDSLAWTADADAAARKITRSTPSHEATEKQVWVRGLVSARARAALAALGWTVHDTGAWRELHNAAARVR